MPAPVAGSRSRIAATFCGSGMNGETTFVSYRRRRPHPSPPFGGPILAAGFARPELIATPDWLAENLGRPDLRVLDVRWRPDGSAPALYATGHVPWAIHLDWRTSVVDAAETGDALLLAAPDKLAAAMARLGAGDGAAALPFDKATP